MSVKLGYLGVGGKCADWVMFSENVLGLESSYADDGKTLQLRMDTYQSRIHVHESDLQDLLYLGWEVGSEEALNVLEERLIRDGVSVSIASDEDLKNRNVARMIHYMAPDGTQTEVFSGPSVSHSRPFHSPRGVGGFVTGDLGLGHIGLTVTDIDKATDYYCNLLGFKVSDYIDFNFGPEPTRVTFLHCNPRHHTLALIPIEAPARLHHLMLELKDLNDVGSGLDAALKNEVPIIAQLGRHTNDHMLSFYMATPSGFGLEYGWGGRLIDDDIWSVEVHSDAAIWGHQGLG